MDNLPVFCDVDDFCRVFEPVMRAKLLPARPRQRNRKSGLCLSEVMTILIGFHRSGYRHFKAYYEEEVEVHQTNDFPGLVSYTRFIDLVPETLLPMCVYLHSRFGQCSGVSFIDSTKLSVCHNRRIWSHQVMAELAARGKTSVDWFYGFKLHLVTNDCGELLAVKITPGNVDDRAPVPDLVAGLFGKLFGDKGYISQSLFEQLYAEGVQLITRLKTNMKERLITFFDKLLLRKRSIIESVIDQLKNISQIEHTRHRSPVNFFVNLLAGLVAYTFQEKKPSLNLRVGKALPPLAI
jgi:Transposase DDE domain